MKKIVLVGQMVGTSRPFEKVLSCLDAEKYDIKTFLAHGQKYDVGMTDIAKVVKEADIVLAGMASSDDLAEEEMKSCEIARDGKIPFGFFSDTFGVYNREYFSHLRDDASFLFVLNDEEAEDARGKFPNAEIIPCGNPIWEDFFFPKSTRSEVRSKLEIKSGEKMLLVSTGKDAVVNTLHISGVIEAISELNSEGFKIIVALHSGHKKYDGDDNAKLIYASFEAYTNLVRIVTKEEMPTSNMIPGCDILIESASTAGIEAACQGIPVVDYFTEIAIRRLEEAGGSRTWRPCDLGVAIDTRDVEKLRSVIVRLLSGGNLAKEMKERQEKIFCKPLKRGASASVIADTLVRFVS